MSISVQGITKTYGIQQALNNVSFEIKEGEIVGFLGPNGAGKSTMMKILTCFLPQTDGKASVCGYDVTTHSMEVRKQVGYLAEHNPLYGDMYVKEYLTFIAGLHPEKIAKSTINARVKDIIDMVGLGLEQHKNIRMLSKGYKQRVGLAQALIHDPKVLILDEPTTGLDPNQISEIRSLIKTIGKKKTVMLSTHIMQEVEAICDRVIIINKGNIVANDTTTNIQHSNEKSQVITIELQANEQQPNKVLNFMQIEGVQHAQLMKPNTWKLISNSPNDIRPAIFQFAVEHQLTILGLTKEEEKLEDVFKFLTQ